MWLALAPLLVSCFETPAAASAARFFSAGLVFHGIVLYWLLANIFWAGSWAIFGYAAMVVYLSLYWGLMGVVWVLLRDRLRAVPLALAVAIAWSAMEVLQGTLLSGFGWCALGYAQGKNPLVLQMASLGGVYLLSALVVAVNVLIAVLLASPGRRFLHAAWIVILLVGAHAGGYFLQAPPDYDTKPFQVGLFQSDFSQDMKWDPEYTEEMVRNAAQKSQALARRQPVDLFIWPEAMVMDTWDAPGIHDHLDSLVRTSDCGLFTGATRMAERGGWTNAGLLIDSEGKLADYYDKVHLAPFGEYMPFSNLFPALRKLAPFIGNMEAGKEQTVFDYEQRCFGPLICFEVLFPSMSERLRAEGADMLVVITNLAWFGRSAVVPQELEISRLRAVETRLPLVHCANTGYSGVFDPWGRFTVIASHDAQIRERPSLSLYRRAVGSMAVAAPGPRLIPLGPRIFPWICVVAAAILLFVAVLFPRKPRSPFDTPVK